MPHAISAMNVLRSIALPISLLSAVAAAPQAVAQSAPTSSADEAVCNATDAAVLLAKSPQRLQQVSLLATRMPEGAPSQILVSAPEEKVSSGEASFRVFTAPDNLGPPTKTNLTEFESLGVTNTQHPNESQAQKSGIKLQDVSRWYLVTVGGPRSQGLSSYLYDHRDLFIAACASNGKLLATGRAHGIRVTNYYTSVLIAFAFTALVYLVLVAVTRALRLALRMDVEVQAPLKWAPITSVPWWRCFDPVIITGDLSDSGSLPKLQILFFTLIVLFELSKIVLRTGVLVDLSSTIAFLLGIPAGGAIATQIAGNNRDRLSPANWSWLVAKGILPLSDRGTNAPMWRDVLTSNGEVDLYKVQAAAFSLLVGVAMLQSSTSDFSTFSVPTSLLDILGLSQLVLFGGRLTGPATLGDLDKLVTELQTRLADLRRAAASGVDVDSGGHFPSPQISGVNTDGSGVQKKGPYCTIDAAGMIDAVPLATSRYLDTANEVHALLQSTAGQKVAARPLLEPLLDRVTSRPALELPR